MLVGPHFREILVNHYFRQLNVTTSDSFYGLESCSDKIHGQVKFIMTKSRVGFSQGRRYQRGIYPHLSSAI